MQLADIGLPVIPFTSALYAAAAAAVAFAVVIYLYSMATNKKRPTDQRRFLLTRLFYLAFMATVVVLSVSSFGSIVTLGHMSGYALLAHIGSAGAFTFLLLAVAFLYLPRGTGNDGERVPADNRWWFARWTAWLLVLSSIVVAATMFLSMLPILDTQGLLDALAIHRFAGLAVASAAVLHVVSLVIVRSGAR